MQRYTEFLNVTLVILRFVVAAVFLVAAYHELPFWSGPIGGISSGMAAIT